MFVNNLEVVKFISSRAVAPDSCSESQPGTGHISAKFKHTIRALSISY